MVRSAMSSWLSHIFVLSSVALVALASPTPIRPVSVLERDFVKLSKKDVASPPVTSPDASTVWTAGTTQTVTWDISNLPEQISNPIGRVVLGFIDDANPSTGYNLMLDQPLAQGFPITAGETTISVPNVPTRSTYVIALIGSSGNISPQFTIVNPTSPELPPGSNTTDSLSPSECIPESTVVATTDATSHPFPPAPTGTDTTPVPAPTATTPSGSGATGTNTGTGGATGTTSTTASTGSNTGVSQEQGNINAAIGRFSTPAVVWTVVIPVMLTFW